MRLLSSCSAALLALVTLMVACTTVDPSECWPNTSGGFGGSGTIPIGAPVGASSGDFASPRFGPLGYGASANPCVTPQGSPQNPPQSPGGADPFTGVAPPVLAAASLKASALAYYMDGMLASSMVDPSDPTALAAAFAQDAPTAEMAVDAWFPTVDPSTVPAAETQPRPQCLDYGCPYSARCINPGSWSTESTICWVVNCGSSKCTDCPDFFPSTLKTFFFVSWCAYTCMDQKMNVVAVGAVGITKKGTPFPSKGLAWCFAP